MKTKFTNNFSEDVYIDTYKFEGNELIEPDLGIDSSFERVAGASASIEKNSELYKEKFKGILTNFKFVAGGRITSNAGTGLKGTTLINCFVSGPTGTNQDSMQEILNELNRQGMILKSEGGYGFNSDFMRPRGCYINGIGVESPGAVKMLEMWDKQSEIITEGSGLKKKEKQGKNKIRKGAMMVTMSCWHPSVEEFIVAKQTPGRLTKFNMSVLISDEFMHAVKNNLPWNLEFPDTTHPEYDQQWDGNIGKWKSKNLPVISYKTFDNANELWDLIMKSTYTRNEPGVLFIDTINKMNNLSYCEYINATNPCLAGESLVAVADGRGYVSIKQLAEEGVDVPVYCYDKSGKLVIRYMRDPRISGYNQKIYKITLDDGSVLRTTGNHKFLLTSNDYKEVKDMIPGESLSLLTKYEGSIKDVFSKAESNQNYWMFKNGIQKTSKTEHRLIAEFHNNGVIPKKHVVHHKDFNSKNNKPDNLAIMLKSDHDKLHGDRMKGSHNPMVRGQTEWSNEKWEAYSKTMSKAIGGMNNGRAYKDVTNKNIEQYALELTKIKSRRFTLAEWQEFALAKKIPSQFSQWRHDFFGGVLGLSKWAATELGLDAYPDADMKTLKKYLKYSKAGLNCSIENNYVLFHKKCELCKKDFSTKQRITAYCSAKCSSIVVMKNPETLSKIKEHRHNRQKLTKEKQIKIFLDLKFENKKEPSRKEWELSCKDKNVTNRLHSGTFKNFKTLIEHANLYNHRVISVELDTVENVYNGTVDDFHNFFVGVESNMLDGQNCFLNFNNKNCGEQVLPPAASCLLGSINLTQYINESNTDFDFNQLEKDIPLIVRFMDNINDISNYPLPEQKEQARLKRRIGLGYLGYASALYILQIKYGSKQALALTDKLCNFVTNKIYQASALLAKEKGCFPLYNQEEFLKSNFIKVLSDETINLIKLYGLRNSHLTSIQPTGNSSVFANNVSSGLEPIFKSEYIRTVIQSTPPAGMILPKIDFSLRKNEGSNLKWDWVQEGDEFLLATKFNETVYKIDQNRGLVKEEMVKDFSLYVLAEKGVVVGNQDWVVDTSSLNIDDHIDTMVVFAKYIDSAISKTVNLPNDYSFDSFKTLYEKIYDTGFIKGCTTYRQGTMSSVLSESSSLGNKIANEDSFMYIKRPKQLTCDINQIKAHGEKWIVLIGLLDNKPYEVFAIKPGKISIPQNLIEGKVIKNGSGKYDLECGDGWVLQDIRSLFETDEQDALTRMISTALRNGVKIEYIVEQLYKAEGSVVSFSKAVARTLKKYVKDTSGLKCPQCSGINVVLEEGCFKCRDCGNSKCQ